MVSCFFQALLSCPTGSIRTETPPTDIGEAQETFPLALDKDKLPVVSHPFSFFFLRMIISKLINSLQIIVKPRKYFERVCFQVLSSCGYNNLKFLTDSAALRAQTSILHCSQMLPSLWLSAFAEADQFRDLYYAQGVFHCGFHSKKSFGATSYLILHHEGNILVDRYIHIYILEGITDSYTLWMQCFS